MQNKQPSEATQEPPIYVKHSKESPSTKPKHSPWESQINREQLHFSPRGACKLLLLPVGISQFSAQSPESVRQRYPLVCIRPSSISSVSALSFSSDMFDQKLHGFSPSCFLWKRTSRQCCPSHPPFVFCYWLIPSLCSEEHLLICQDRFCSFTPLFAQRKQPSKGTVLSEAATFMSYRRCCSTLLC